MVDEWQHEERCEHLLVLLGSERHVELEGESREHGNRFEVVEQKQEHGIGRNELEAKRDEMEEQNGEHEIEEPKHELGVC